MIRAVLLVAVFASAAATARAQGTGQDIWSGSASGLQSGFQGSVSSGFSSGSGTKSPPAAVTPPVDATLALGGTGQFGPSAIAGQPSNYLPSVTATAPFGGPIVPENGPAGPLTFQNGPAGPMD